MSGGRDGPKGVAIVDHRWVKTEEHADHALAGETGSWRACVSRACACAWPQPTLPRPHPDLRYRRSLPRRRPGGRSGRRSRQGLRGDGESVGVLAPPQPVVQDDVVPGLQLLDEPCPDRLDHRPFALEVGVLGVVHAVSAMEAVHLLVHGPPRVAVVGSDRDGSQRGWRTAHLGSGRQGGLSGGPESFEELGYAVHLLVGLESGGEFADQGDAAVGADAGGEVE